MSFVLLIQPKAIRCENNESETVIISPIGIETLEKEPLKVAIKYACSHRITCKSPHCRYSDTFIKASREKKDFNAELQE
jgi:hypothetical protein